VQNAQCGTNIPEQKCANTTLPLENAEYYDECNWRCVTGYTMQRKQYLQWEEYVCVLTSSLQTAWWWREWY
jgi:hypothetical protein